MFLLNDEMILEYKKEGWLDIEEFELELLHPTYYYFRLGKWVQIWDASRKDYYSEE